MIAIDIVEDNHRLAGDLELSLGKEAGFRVRAVFADAAAALAGVSSAPPPDVFIVDLNLPDMDGCELIAKLKPLCLGTQFLVLTMYDDTRRIFEALKAGATGYVLKRASASELAVAIREIHAGGAPMSSSIARQVVQSFNETAAPSQSADAYGLSEREAEVLERLSRGDLYKEVAAQLSISIDTVRSHVRKIYEKLQVHNRSHAIEKYRGRRN